MNGCHICDVLFSVKISILPAITWEFEKRKMCSFAAAEIKNSVLVLNEWRVQRDDWVNVEKKVVLDGCTKL